MKAILVLVPNFAATGFMLALLVAERFRRAVAGWFFASRFRPWLLPGIILALYSIVTLGGGQWRPGGFLLVGLYFGVPTLLILRGFPRTPKATLLDAILVLLIWLPQEAGIFEIPWASIGAVPWPLAVFVTVSYMLVVLTGWRGLALACPGSLRWRDLGAVGLAYLVLLAVILPLGILVRFVIPGLNAGLIGSPGQFILMLLGIFFAVAIPEEILFRGWIQNLLLTRLKVVPGLLTAAVIFGLSHLDNSVVNSARTFESPDWWYALFATIAGLAYGAIYQKRRSLFAAALLHTLVDFTWLLFFTG
jgi:membrane protease YdiL (CAAX protease family)